MAGAVVSLERLRAARRNEGHFIVFLLSRMTRLLDFDSLYDTITPRGRSGACYGALAVAASFGPDSRAFF